jgi:uncharacterized protein YbjT (DUF2867 family)
MTKPVLVTSAAGGRQGKTGRHISEMLLKRGVPVRAFVRIVDDRAKQLRALVPRFSRAISSISSRCSAPLKGTSAIYFAYPVRTG